MFYLEYKNPGSFNAKILAPCSESLNTKDAEA